MSRISLKKASRTSKLNQTNTLEKMHEELTKKTTDTTYTDIQIEEKPLYAVRTYTTYGMHEEPIL